MHDDVRLTHRLMSHGASCTLVQPVGLTTRLQALYEEGAEDVAHGLVVLHKAGVLSGVHVDAVDSVIGLRRTEDSSDMAACSHLHAEQHVRSVGV